MIRLLTKCCRIIKVLRLLSTAPTTAPVVSSTVPTANSQNASSSITTALANDGKIIENFSSSEGATKGSISRR